MSDQYQPVETKLHFPGLGLMLGVGGLFGLVGLGVASLWYSSLGELPEGVDLFTKAGFDAHGDIWVQAAISSFFVPIGWGLVIFASWRSLHPIYVRHAPAEEFPEVPKTPTLGRDATSWANMTHELKPGRLAPSTRVLNAQRMFLILFPILFGAFVTFMLMGLRPLDGFGQDPESSTLVHGVISGFACLALGAAGFVIDRLSGRHLNQLPILEFTREDWQLIEDGKVLATGERAQLVGLQLVGTRSKVETHKGTQYRDVMELNLVRRDEAGEIQRHNLLRLGGSLIGLVRLTGKLAEQLRLPVLFQGSPEDWRAERRRARGRRPQRRQ